MELNMLKAEQTLQFRAQRLAAHRSILWALRHFSFELVADFEIFCIIKNTLNFSLLLEVVATQGPDSFSTTIGRS